MMSNAVKNRLAAGGKLEEIIKSYLWITETEINENKQAL